MKRINLTKLGQSSLTKNEMNSLHGGDEYHTCGCSCYYEGEEGGSSANDNGFENAKGDMHSPKGVNRPYRAIEKKQNA